MFGFCTALVGWYMQPGTVRPVRYYRVADDFCDGVRSRFFEDWMFTWKRLTCEDLHTMIRHAFDSWQYNSENVFYETRNETGADVVIGTEWLEQRQWIALARRSTRDPGEIHVDMDQCWYTDRHFCHAVDRDTVPLFTGLGLTWVGFLCIALYNLCRRPIAYVSIPRILVWVVVLAVPMLALGSLLPCLSCYDFTAIMIHEVGHVLGFGHSNDANLTQTCGCGGDARLCAEVVSDTGSVMHSVAQRRNTLCLSQDDVDAVRSIYGGVCGDPIWCYEFPTAYGYTRVSTAILYSFIVASAIVFVRNRTRDRCFPSRTVVVQRDENVVVASTPASRRRPPPVQQRSRSMPSRGRGGAAVHRI